MSSLMSTGVYVDVTPSALRHAQLPLAPVHKRGYSRGDVDHLLGRAASKIEVMQRRIAELQQAESNYARVRRELDEWQRQYSSGRATTPPSDPAVSAAVSAQAVEAVANAQRNADYILNEAQAVIREQERQVRDWYEGVVAQAEQMRARAEAAMSDAEARYRSGAGALATEERAELERHRALAASVMDFLRGNNITTGLLIDMGEKLMRSDDDDPGHLRRTALEQVLLR